MNTKLTCSRNPFEDLRHPLKSSNHGAKVAIVYC